MLALKIRHHHILALRDKKKKKPTWDWDVDDVADLLIFVSFDITPVQAVIMNGNPSESQDWDNFILNMILSLSYFYVFCIVYLFTFVEQFTPGDIQWLSTVFDRTTDCQGLSRSNLPCRASLDHQLNFTWRKRVCNNKKYIYYISLKTHS